MDFAFVLLLYLMLLGALFSVLAIVADYFFGYHGTERRQQRGKK